MHQRQQTPKARRCIASSSLTPNNRRRIFQIGMPFLCSATAPLLFRLSLTCSNAFAESVGLGALGKKGRPFEAPANAWVQRRVADAFAQRFIFLACRHHAISRLAVPAIQLSGVGRLLHNLPFGWFGVLVCTSAACLEGGCIVVSLQYSIDERAARSASMRFPQLFSKEPQRMADPESVPWMSDLRCILLRECDAPTTSPTTPNSFPRRLHDALRMRTRKQSPSSTKTEHTQPVTSKRRSTGRRVFSGSRPLGRLE